ncbi:MAG: hypothetical protein R2755_11025 [Acidimicrobiales bacterium]
MADLEDLAARLDHLADELADAAMDALRDAMAEGERKPELERRLTCSRRSVERAAALVRGAPAADD